MKKRAVLGFLTSVLTASMMTTSWAAGWKNTGGRWQWQKADGNLSLNEWQQSDRGNWFRFDAAGNMQFGWIRDGGYNYFLESDSASASFGKMMTGWQQISGNWYFMNTRSATAEDPTPKGAMMTGWQWVDGKCYFFQPDGRMLAGVRTPDGFELDDNGAWAENGLTVNIPGKGRPGQEDGTQPSGFGNDAGLKFAKAGGFGGGSGGSGGGGSSGGGSDVSDDDFDETNPNDGTDGNLYRESESEREEVAEVISDFKAQHIRSGMSDFEKEMEIVKYIAANTSYETVNVSENKYSEQTAYSALVKHVTVCAGYSDAFLRMAKACGLNAKYIVGKNHAWNAVELDGDWYTLDLTYADHGNGENAYKSASFAGKINLQDCEMDLLDYSHSSQSPSTANCTGYKYSPEVVAGYLTEGTIDTSLGISYRTRLQNAVDQYKAADGQVHIFRIAADGSGEDAVTDYIRAGIDSRASRLTFAFSLPYAYFPASSWLKGNALMKKVSQDLENAINKDPAYRGALYKDLKLYPAGISGADGLFLCGINMATNFKPLNPNTLNYTVRFVDQDNKEISAPLTGTVKSGDYLEIAYPEGYSREAKYTSVTGVKKGLTYNKKTRMLFVGADYSDAVDLTIRLTRYEGEQEPASPSDAG